MQRLGDGIDRTDSPGYNNTGTFDQPESNCVRLKGLLSDAFPPDTDEEY